MGRRRVDLQEAAELLGISSDAVRKRAKRGTIPYETGADGRLYVWVDDGETQNYPPGETDKAELIEELRDRVRYLEEESRRKDHLLAAALERIPAIEAPRDDSGAGGHRSASEGEADTETPGEDTDQPRRSSWWRRFFGFD